MLYSKKYFLLTGLLFALLFQGCKKEPESPIIPLEDFFKNPKQTNFQLSPNGEKISFLQPYKNRMNLFVCNFDSSDIVRITSDTLRDIDSYFWSGSNRLVYLQDTDGDENYKLIAVNIDGSGTVNLTPFEGTKVFVIDDLPDNDDEMIIAMNRRNPSIFDAYKINVNTGELTLLMQNPGNITSWFTDNKGSD